MYKLIVLVVLLLTMACTTQTTVNSILFHDAQGIAYESSSAGQIIKKNYNLDSFPTIIVLATNDIKSPLFMSQLKDINAFNAEEYGYLLVIANAANIDSSGYYTSIEEAESILKDNEFKIIIMKGQGDLVIESTKTLGTVELKKYLTNL
jgi:hypothetical protein